MDKSQIKQIEDYIKNLEEELSTGNYSHISMQAKLPNIHKNIKLLIDATFNTKHHELKILLPYMEMRLRKCKQCIEGRLHTGPMKG